MKWVYTMFALSTLSQPVMAASDEEVDSFMIKIVSDTIPLLPIIVDEHSQTTSMFYDTEDNVLLYGVEVSTDALYSQSQLDLIREQVQQHSIDTGCQMKLVRDILNMNVQIEYRYHRAIDQQHLFAYQIRSSDCGVEI